MHQTQSVVLCLRLYLVVHRMRNLEQSVVLLHVPVPEHGRHELLHRQADRDGPALPDNQVPMLEADRGARGGCGCGRERSETGNTHLHSRARRSKSALYKGKYRWPPDSTGLEMYFAIIFQYFST